MAKSDRINVSLPDDVVIFRELAAFSRAFEERGLRLHVVGGMAVTIWGLYTDSPRPGMTSDIDSVITSAVMADDIEGFAGIIDSIMRARGYSRREGWERTRADRFRYVGIQDVKFELLCGTPSVGRPSGTPPAHRLYRDRESGLVLYAAKTPWLDLVPSWVQIDASCGEERFSLNTPGLAGLIALKIGAVRDKQARIESVRRKSRSAAAIVHELARLAQHAADLVLVREMLESQAALPELADLCMEHPTIRAAAKEAAAWLDDSEADHASLLLHQGILRGSPDPLHHALII